MISVLFDGKVWGQELGPIGDVEVGHKFSQSGGGLAYVKFSLALPRRFYHPVLKAGTSIKVFRGPVPLGSATLSEPDREGWTFAADGLYRRAETTSAFVGAAGSAPTTNPQAAVTAANTYQDLGWNGAGALPNASMSTEAEAAKELNSIATLLNNYCKLTGKYWGLDNYDVPYIVDAPSVPEWSLRPGRPLMPTNDDTSVSVVRLRYVVSRNPDVFDYVTAGTPDPDGHEVILSTADLGPITLGAAQAYADDYLAKNAVRVTYLEGIDVAPGQLTNLGSTPIDAWSAGLTVCGKRGLHFGVIDKRIGTDYGRTIQWVCGSTVYKPAENSLQIYAVDFAPRVLANVVKDVAAAQAAYQARQDRLQNADA